ncbi:hypothetical protein JR316_0012853 [Psilocybe cubensis]|uniref:Uncharacterized protein n=2 Tax=Psilocybe cubensis TaxID=181762 RepID=A0ACB8GH64_PSICU|nr:hypothetical protein JR316_0012853 [Psilocybe cubensis]KAH9474395.1 hypothetical protein JR316_0012853 [Psilocybe cubensis]
MTVNSELHIQNLDPIRLPIEIVNTIVDATLLKADESSNSKLISSIALLSRECRRSANRLRFSSLNFDTESSSFVWETRRIRELSALVRLPPHNQETKYALSLDFMDYVSVPWGSLGENIREQLVDLLRHSFLYEIRIYNICDIPGDLFHGSNIKSLVFGNILIDNPNQPYTAESTAPIQLRLLKFDAKTISYYELLQMIGITTLTPIIIGQAFSQLTSLSIQINPMLVSQPPVCIQELLAHTPKLEYLCIQTVPIMLEFIFKIFFNPCLHSYSRTLAF